MLQQSRSGENIGRQGSLRRLRRQPSLGSPRGRAKGAVEPRRVDVGIDPYGCGDTLGEALSGGCAASSPKGRAKGGAKQIGREPRGWWNMVRSIEEHEEGSSGDGAQAEQRAAVEPLVKDHA